MITAEEIAAAGLKPPRNLTLMITPNCNLACGHCWLDCVPQSQPNAVPTAVCSNLIRDFACLGGRAVSITGGEALTHPDWEAILSCACREKSYEEVRLQTNATLLSEAAVTALKGLCRQVLVIQVSLDGATAKTHDRVRGVGSFRRAMRGLQRLTDAGLGEIVEIAFTEMAHNFNELPKLLTLVEEIGARCLVSGTIVKGGRAARTDSLRMPSPSQYQFLLDRYHADHQFRKRYRKFGRISTLEWFLGRSQALDHICSCIESPFISADGKMYPCVMFLNDAYAAPDLHRRALSDVVRDMLPRWSELPRIERQRRAGLYSCRGCAGRAHCGGGCMGRAFAAHGDLMTVEDRCALRQAVYAWRHRDEGVKSIGG